MPTQRNRTFVAAKTLSSVAAFLSPGIPFTFLFTQPVMKASRLPIRDACKSRLKLFWSNVKGASTNISVLSVYLRIRFLLAMRPMAKKVLCSVVIGLALGSCATREVFECKDSAEAIATMTAGEIPKAKRVVMVMLENTDMTIASEQPFLRELAKRGALLKNSHGVARPSQPNYIALTAGSIFNMGTNGKYSLPVRHIGHLLEEKGKTWKVYAEGYPGGCFLGETAGAYARRHVPMLSFRDVQDNPSKCAQVLPADRFDTDVDSGQLADFNLFIPNNDSNGHDTGVKHADQWLKSKFEPLLNDPIFMDGTLFVVTFDESGPDQENHIYTAMIGHGVKAGSESGNCYDHYDILRTVEETLDLGTLGRKDASGKPVQGIWSS